MGDLGKFFAASGPLGGAVGAQNLLSIENPIASGINLFVMKIRAHGVVAAISTGVVEYRLSRTTAVPSAGTAITAMKRVGSDPGPVGIVKTGPTVTSTGNFGKRLAAGLLVTAAGEFIPAIPNMFEANEEQFAIRIAPNQAILIDVSANLAAWSHFVEVEWEEASQ